MKLLLGLRSEKFSKGNTIFIDPRFSGSYHLSDRFSLKVSASRSHQFLNRFSNDFITNGSKFVWLIPNKHMKPMSSIQKNFGFEYDSPEIFFGFDLYNKNVTNISDFSQFVFPIDVYSESSNNLTFQGEGKSNGYELFFHKKKGKLKGWASYNYGTIKYKFPDLNGGEIFLADHDRTHELKSAIISSIGSCWSSTMTVSGKGSHGITRIVMINITLRRYRRRRNNPSS